MATITALRFLCPTRFPIRVRLLGAFAAVLLLTGGVAAVSLDGLSQVILRTRQLTDEQIPQVHFIWQLRLLVTSLEMELLHILVEHADRTSHVEAARRWEGEAERAVAAYRRLHPGPLPREHVLLEDMTGLHGVLRDTTRQVLRLIDRGEHAAAKALVLGPWQTRYAALMQATDRMLAYEDRQVLEAALAAEAQARRGRTILAGLALLAIPLCLALSLVITRSITRPVERLIQLSERASRGDLTPDRLQPDADEIGLLTTRFGEMMSALARSFEQQRVFLADASHELRTPLSVIRGEAEVALRAGATRDVDWREALTTIVTHADQMGRTVEDLLFLARSRAHQVDYQRAPVELEVLLDRVCSHARGAADRHGVKLRLDAGAPVTVRGDAQRLTELFRNLVDNAIRYTPAGGHVRVTLDAEGGTARVVVSDTGVGIPPDELPRVFDRFYRGRLPRARSPEGAGLGLPIASAIAKAHGGQIAVESEAGRGSRFTVRMPLDRPPE